MHGRTAQEVVNEVRRQFIERPGIMVSKCLNVVVFPVLNEFSISTNAFSNYSNKHAACHRITRRSLIMVVVLQL